MNFLLPHEFPLTPPPNDIFWVIRECKEINLKVYSKYYIERQILYFHMFLKLFQLLSKYLFFFLIYEAQ